MFMFKASVVEKLEREKKELEKEIQELKTMCKHEELMHTNEIAKNKQDLSFVKREYEIKTQEELNKLRKEMEKSLVTSDLIRTEAVAKLAIYEKMNVKDDANTIKEMAKELIKAVSSIASSKVNIVK